MPNAAVMNLVVNETIEDDSDNQHMLFALIDAIGDKIDAKLTESK